MRQETALDILKNLALSSSGDFQTAFDKEIIGSTVLTSYNNKTYRIADVDWNSNPLSTFDTKDGKVSYSDYYRKVRN